MNVPVSRKASVGRIAYRTTFIPNPAYRGGRADLFSDELHAQLRRHNVPERRVVYFDGRNSRSEEINVDYGVKSPSFELRTAGRDTITYCKDFPFFGFCVERPVALPFRAQPPIFTRLDEVAMIAGVEARKGNYLDGSRRLHVWSTDAWEIDDPTGAVLHLDGVPGLILQIEEISDSVTADALERTTVTELSFEPPPPGIFLVPTSYRRFGSIDAARAEDRRILDAKSAAEAERHPPGAEGGETFVGRWRLAGPHDEILVEIARAESGEFRFRTTILTAPVNAHGRVREERACLKGRLLLVEDPPNDRLYRLGEDGSSLIQVGNEIFTFTRH